MTEYNHKGEWCTYKDILCQEGVCARCYITIENRKNDTVGDPCEKLNTEY